MKRLLTSAFTNNIPSSYETLVSRLDDVALQAILIRLVEEIPEEKLGEFEAALALSDPRILDAFLQKEVPQLRYIVAETLSRLEHGATEMISVLES